MLTNAQIKAAKPKEKQYELTDAFGLFLLVKPNGSKLWRVRTVKEGKRKVVSAGKYPDISLKDAREMRDQLKKEAAEKQESGMSFQEIAIEWHTKQSNTWTEKHSKTVIQRLEKNVFPFLGHIGINDISPKMILDVLKKIEERGKFETAHRVRSIIGQVYRYGIPHEYCERDITQDLRGALTPVKVKHLASITDPVQIGILLKAIDQYQGTIPTLYGLKIMPHVFVRSYAFRYAEWTEFDFEAKLWRIPGDKMKKKEPLLVPLSHQVISMLRELEEYTGSNQYLFVGSASNKPISDATLRNALIRLGYSRDEITIHGFRHMASTRLNEMGYNPDWIERQLAHTEGDKVRAAYNHAEYLPQRTQMMQDWSDYLDKLKLKQG